MPRKTDVAKSTNNLLNELAYHKANFIKIINDPVNKNFKVSYKVEDGTEIQIVGPSIEVITNAMLFQRLATEYKKRININRINPQTCMNS